MHGMASGVALLQPGQASGGSFGLSVAVRATACAGGPGTEVAADLVFAALDLPASPMADEGQDWVVLQPQTSALREALMLASVAQAAVYLPPAIQLGLAWLAQQARIAARVDPRIESALGEQVAGWLLAVRRLPTSIGRARRGDEAAETLARARAALHACLPGRGGLDAIAAQAKLTRGQLNRVMRRGCGLSVGRYRSELRLRRAALLILIDGQRCAEASAAVGYRSGSQFSQEFAQLFGVRPSRLVGLIETLLSHWARAA